MEKNGTVPLVPLSCNVGTDPQRNIQAGIANQFDEFHQVVIPLEIELHIQTRFNKLKLIFAMTIHLSISSNNKRAQRKQSRNSQPCLLQAHVRSRRRKSGSYSNLPPSPSVWYPATSEHKPSSTKSINPTKYYLESISFQSINYPPPSEPKPNSTNP